MTAQTLYAAVLGILCLISLLFLLRVIYRMLIFRLMAEQREIILKSSYLLDDKHALNDQEIRAVACAIKYLYDYRFKTYAAKFALEQMKKGVPKPKSELREEVKRVSMAFASMCLAENPFVMVALLNKQSEMREVKITRPDPSPLVRAEIEVASQIPAWTSHKQGHELAMC